MMLRVLWIVILIKAGFVSNCPKEDLTFEKVIGLSPTNVTINQLLFRLNSTESRRPITLDCIKMCEDNNACQSFVLFYHNFECYWFDHDVTVEDDSSTVDVDAAWFVKVCLKIGQCSNKLWAFEVVKGATLVNNDTKILPNYMSRTECQQVCINETSFICKSIKFKTNSQFHNDTVGQCILSNSDRHLMPFAYRVSTNNDYYLEYQCTNNHSQVMQDMENDCHAYEEYDNAVFIHEDALITNVTKDECQNQCDFFEKFNCRGYTFTPQQCALHSEDTKLRGPRALSNHQGATYHEKVNCINVSVSCSETYMTVRYNPDINFRGKMYMQGNSENPACYVLGQGKHKTLTLKLPLLISQCGLVQANSPSTRILMSGTLILQYNQFVQTQSDRILKVGCIFGNESKILVGTGINITTNYPNIGSPLLNTTTNTTVPPVVEMRIVDSKTLQETSDSQIGQKLQLIIELKEKSNTFDLWASHLIAMTERGDESIFLLDDRGCPTNLNIFPPLDKVVTNTSKKLVSTFEAFKFASSPIVRFSVIVQFCSDKCLPIKCDNNIESYGRRKREISHSSTTIETVHGNQTVKRYNNVTTIIQNSSVVNHMPLEYIMVVRNSEAHPDKLIYGNKDGVILVAGYDYVTNEVCLDFSLVIGLIVTWIVVQIIFITACIILVKRYRKHYQQQCTRTSLEELHKNFGLGYSNLENRRVRWADNEDHFI